MAPENVSVPPSATSASPSTSWKIVPEIVRAVVALTLSPNSEVSLVVRSVAVAVTTAPTGATAGSVVKNDALPLASVETVVAPMKVRPSPYPLASPWPAGFQKNSMRKLRLAVLLRLPAIVICPTPSVAAPVSAGKFCRRFAPVSPSPPSFAVTPSPTYATG